jgi:hypothetical protein
MDRMSFASTTIPYERVSDSGQNKSFIGREKEYSNHKSMEYYMVVKFIGFLSLVIFYSFQTFCYCFCWFYNVLY